MTDSSEQAQESTNTVYRALVVDSGPIIRLTGLSGLRDKAISYYTVPAVLHEIRDAKARQHLQQLPFELQTRDASPEGIQAVVEFARQTGDYSSLSAVDVQVLGLLYDLEREGCHGNTSHVRTTPKRTVGVGRIESLVKNDDKKEEVNQEQQSMKPEEKEKDETGTHFFQGETIVVNEHLEVEGGEEAKQQQQQQPPTQKTATAPMSWARMVNPAASATPQPDTTASEVKVANQAMHTMFGTMNLSGKDDQDVGGQFSDAEEDSSNSSDYDDSGKEISDEECDVYVLDPEEVEARKLASTSDKAALRNELEQDFPSLTASLQVPYEGSDDEGSDNDSALVTPAILKKEEAEMKKQEALKPVTKSGKLYNSFRGYSDIMKPKVKSSEVVREEVEEKTPAKVSDDDGEEEHMNKNEDGRSRIIGGATMAGQETEFEDDGEGWITSPTDIRKMKAAGRLNPTQNPAALDENVNEKAEAGPPICQRAACTTTDFAMQNVILQMNLELLSVDGIKVRRLKSWVTRCGACFTVFADGEDVGPVNTKRMFCSRCGCDTLQRVAASVDGKTGRLRLHLSKKYKNNLRGTKFSLPKPGTVSIVDGCTTPLHGIQRRCLTQALYSR